MTFFLLNVLPEENIQDVITKSQDKKESKNKSKYVISENDIKLTTQKPTDSNEVDYSNKDGKYYKPDT